MQLPAISTSHAVLDRYHLVKRPTEPDALWYADYKGKFMLGNRRYC